MSKTCSVCRERSAWAVIDKFGFMEPGTLCPVHYLKWRRTAWEHLFIFHRLPWARAVIERYNGEKLVRIAADEEHLDNEVVFIQERMAKTMDRIKSDAIIEAIEHHNHNVAKATRELGISKAMIYRCIKRYGIELRRSAKVGKKGE